MHLSDALVSPTVAGGAGAIAITLLGVASRKIKKESRQEIIPLMAVMGAFVFAAQMINFAIPGTGSSGHLIGGVLLGALLGPWCAFITLSSILIVQCLFFADGGILALGCNILNMAASSCLIAYPFVYKPIAGESLKPVRLITASIAASIVALQIGSLGVIAETELSGVTALPAVTFASFMLPIHFLIAIVEGMVTASLIMFVANYRPQMLAYQEEPTPESKAKSRKVLIFFSVITLIFAAGFTIMASSNPDGLEWSIEKVSGLIEMESYEPATAFMADYESKFSGIVGTLIVLVLIWALSSLIFAKYKPSVEEG